MRRLSLTTALGLSLLFFTGGESADAARVDKASTHTAARAWLRFAHAGVNSLATARRTLDAYQAATAASCPGALDPVNAIPPESLNWRILNEFLTEAVYDADILTANALKTSFDRFAKTIGALPWSKRGIRATVRRSLDLQRRYVFQGPSDLCADARTFASNANASPTATLQFLNRADRNGTAAGLVGLRRTLERYANAADRRVLGKIDSLIFNYGLDAERLIFDRQEQLLRILGLTEPLKLLDEDAAAQSDARNMVTQVEVCFTDTQDYRRCRTPANTGLPLGPAAGQVEVVVAEREAYTVVAHSLSGTDFTITKSAAGTVTRTCNKPELAGCGPGGQW
jgi:type IV pilus assembly protein PilA